MIYVERGAGAVCPQGCVLCVCVHTRAWCVRVMRLDSVLESDGLDFNERIWEPLSAFEQEMI